jgi:hypothetical protein
MFIKSFLIILLPVLLLAQSSELVDQLSEIVEDDSEALEALLELLDDPVNLNTASLEDLMKIPILEITIADSILKYRKKRNRFTSKKEVEKITGKETYRLIKDFISIRSIRANELSYINKHYFPIDFEANDYWGDQNYSLNKIYYAYKDRYKLGFITHKDPGEYDYFDYYAGYFQYRSQRSQLIIGKYYLHFGHGLQFSNPFGRLKSSLPLTPLRVPISGGRATISSAENNNHNGLYYRFVYQNISLFAFGSYAKRDVLYAGDPKQIVGIDYSGYHRNKSEFSGKNKLTEKMIGGALEHTITPGLKYGIVFSGTFYHPAIVRTRETLGEQEFAKSFYRFSGNKTIQSSLFYQAKLSPLELSGEISLSDWKENAFSQSAVLKRKSFQLGFNFWRVLPGFQSPNGRSFDDGSPFPSAKEGYYLAFAIKLYPEIWLRSYKIFEKDLWRTWFSPIPKQKSEWLWELEYQDKNIQFFARYRRRQADESLMPSIENQMSISEVLKNNYRLQFLYKMNKTIHLKSRWEKNIFAESEEQGVLFFQDIRYFFSETASLNGRISFFRSASYDSRIYEYESDLPGSFSNYPLYGEGGKFFLLLRFGLSKNFQFYFKYRYLAMRDKTPSEANYYHQTTVYKRELRVMMKFVW